MEKVMAYRGFRASYPENTMAALKEICKTDVFGIHVDVQVLLDKTVVVHRDVPLGRCENKEGHIYDYRRENFQTFSVGEKFSDEYKNECIPYFEDVVRKAKENDKFLGVEISYDARPDICFKNDPIEPVMAILKKYDMLKKCYITSYNHIMLKEIKEKYPEVKVLITFMTEHTHNLDIPAYVSEHGFDGVHCHLSYVTKEFSDKLRENNQILSIFGIASSDLYKMAEAFNADFINTDLYL